MPALSFNPFHSLDKYFLFCKLVTALFCLLWPVTLVPTLMSLAGYIAPETPLYKVILIRGAWFLALVYPLVFFAVVLFAENVLAHRFYILGAAVALLPAAFAVFVIVTVLRA